jgi:Dolichyl-phosphate-mannose-protein mannosyltransferase
MDPNGNDNCRKSPVKRRMSAGSISEANAAGELQTAPESSERQALVSRWPPKLFRGAVAALFLAPIFLLQWLGGAYRNEFAGYPDEGAHYITGLMVRDYLAGRQITSMMRFAENYYLHYPKVAIGHWPPFFFMLEGVWTLAFPTSRTSLLILMGLLTTLMAFTLYRILEDEFGSAVGITGGLFLLALPVIQAHSAMVMADILAGLLSFWAVLLLARVIENGRWVDAASFGVLAAMTLLTKGTGLGLALVPLFALLFARRWHPLRRPVFWFPLLIIIPLCGPWYWITRHMLPNTWQQAQPGLNFTRRAVPYYSWHLLHILGVGLSVFAAVGLVEKIILPRRQQVSGKWAVLAGLLFSTLLLAWVVPAGYEERYLIPAVPAALAFAFAGVDYIAQRIPPQKLNLAGRRFLCTAILAAVFLLGTFFVPRTISFGFAPVAEYILSKPELAKAVLLLSSDATGDGMFISELAMREKRPGHYVLRATKVLCDCSWLGDQRSSRYATPEELMSYFDHSPIQVVVDDESVPPHATLDSHRVLDDTIQSYGDRWKLLGSFPISRNGVVYPKGIQVYSISGTDPGASVEIDLRRMLNKTIQLQPQ